jgi:hypothetical protein
MKTLNANHQQCKAIRSEEFNFYDELKNTQLGSSTGCTDDFGDTLQLSIRNNQYNEIHPVAIRYLGNMAIDGDIDIYYRDYRVATKLIDKNATLDNDRLSSYIFRNEISPEQSPAYLENEYTVNVEQSGESELIIIRQATLVVFMAVLWELDKSIYNRASTKV